jgi:large subunit ribosomal protein L21
MEEVKTTKKTAVKKAEPKKAVEKAVTAKKTEQVKPEVAGVFAVIKTGGKQYVVTEGRTYDFEKLDLEEGKEVVFEALLVADKSSVKIGDPIVTGVKVTGKVVSQFRDDKVLVLKYKPKKRYHKSYGHRQSLTKVEITKIA